MTTLTNLQPVRATGSASLVPAKGRVLTGDRPTGKLHLGHYFGTLANRVRLQQAGHELIIVVADYQVVADRDHPGDLDSTVHDMVLDYLGCGLDPARTTIFVHSQIPELNQLILPFLSLVSMGELSRNPTIKDEIRLADRGMVSGLMLTYPVHQAADVLFCKSTLVPVGRDQLPHLELTRSIARRFNDRYGAVFELPEGILSQTPVLVGLDGQKMGKSRGNAINLDDTDDQIVAKIRAARTDGQRQISYQPRQRPEVATLLRLAALCRDTDPHRVAEEIGSRGAAALKQLVIESVIELLTPIRLRRADYERADAHGILANGNSRARELAGRTLNEVRAAMNMSYGFIETPLLETPLLETPLLETPLLETPLLETPLQERR
ncbi:MAG TPA: tryptophan--tRNA ligase [Jatrophihabitans sp.]|jgi:tryptophanyl-tRNA synthetase